MSRSRACSADSHGRVAVRRLINQAPMYRRTQHPWLRLYDLGANALHTWASIRHLPPDQLLRRVFESCGTYAETKDMLENTPVARP